MNDARLTGSSSPVRSALRSVAPAIIGLALGTISLTAQAPVFSSRVDTVRVDVSVRNGTEVVRGLGLEDFELLDNGVRQKVEYVGFEETPVHVVLALDMSGSVRGTRLTQLRQAGARLAGLLQAEDQGALVVFTDLVTIRSGFTGDKRLLLSRLDEPARGSDTSLLDAIHAAMVLGETGAGRPLVIIFSDGADTASFLTEPVVLDTARRTGPVVYAVTTPAEGRGEGFLEELTRLTGGRRLEVASLDRLSQAFQEILAEARQRYLISYTPTGVPPGGWHEVTVRVRRGRAQVHARPGYLRHE